MSKPKHFRTIKSFVIREGRITPGQQRALDNLWSVWGIEFTPAKLDWSAQFHNKNPIIIEIGFGMGHSLVQMAAEQPAVNFVGIEVHRPGVGTLLKDLDEQNVTNLKTMCHDAVEVLEQQVPDESIDGFQIYFPDPWHKARHHKRRLIQPKFITHLLTKLKPGGFIHLATDWENYAEQMMEVLSEFSELENTHGENQYADQLHGRPETKFQRRGERLGHGVWDLYFVKKS